jgi:hypothetical protein
MTVHRDRFLVNKPTDELSSNFIIGVITLHVSGSLSAHHQEFRIDLFTCLEACCHVTSKNINCNCHLSTLVSSKLTNDIEI